MFGDIARIPILHNCTLPSCVNFHYPMDCHQAESIIYSGLSGDTCGIIVMYNLLVTLATLYHVWEPMYSIEGRTFNFKWFFLLQINVTGFGTDGHPFAVFMTYLFSFTVFTISSSLANQYDPDQGWRIALIVLAVLTGLVSLYKGTTCYLAWKERRERRQEDEEGYIRIVPST